jgi:hypothetical protein
MSVVNSGCKSRRHERDAVEALLDLHESLEKSKALANEEKIAIDGLMSLRLSSESPVAEFEANVVTDTASQNGFSENVQIDHLSAEGPNKQDACVQVY